MKLRLRSTETKETLRLEVPNHCSLLHLKQSLSQSISAAPSSSLRLSLNRRDELLPSSSENDSLASLGITSGDLIFYSLIPHTSVSPIPQTLIREGSASTSEAMAEDPRSNSEFLTGEGAASTSQEAMAEAPMPETLIGEARHAVSDSQTLIDGGDSISETLSGEASYFMEIDDESGGGVRKKYSVPFFLRRVMREELAEDRSDHKLLVIALHAVLSESRFVRFDSVSGELSDRFCLPKEWPAVAYTLSLSYTLPEILQARGGGKMEAVVLKVQTLGQFVNVYGSLAAGGGGGGPYRVSLDVRRFAPMLDFVWGCRNVSDDEVFVPEVEIFEFWRIVKDGITYPLLIDLCEKAGLPEPASFVCLPLDLKMNILERLSGADIAKVGCACKELQNLANNDELWKQKFVEEFGSGGGGGGGGGVGNWKFRFAGKWEDRERHKKAVVMWRDHVRPGQFIPMRREPIPFVPGFPGIIRDPPGFGVPDPFGRPQVPYPLGGSPVIFRHGRRRRFSPDCNLGGGFSG
ncbi:F-box protein SKIP22-like [Argentina anserina]|uniref:F-box protein SKIP22-like n=1 Tax=Argentina anserina TaxID=57926 RepID=UPI00217640F9|nr:F-box protein SKIP22-like [Potentilla anserina]